MARIACDPWTVFVARWNWKSALLSGTMRGAVYGLVLVRHPEDAIRGAGIEMAFRVVFGGCWGSLLQALRRVRPPWMAAVLLPVPVQALEYAVLRLASDRHLKTAMVTSALLTAGSLAVNYSLMRRGLLLTDDGAGTLASDFRRLPRVLGECGRLAAGSVRRVLGAFS
jgi:hypothetical protein